MKENIKISVVVPVYNLQGYIERCIRSILSQTHTNIEILVVDDGSADNSKVIISKMAEMDSRIVPIFKENGGVTSARLVGVKEATGEWIGFVDGDDEIEADMYECLLDNALKYGADISHCGYQMIFLDGRINYFHNTNCVVEQDRITGLKDLLEGSLVEPGLCNKLFHKNLLHTLLYENVMNTEIKINEDLLMNYILFSKARKSVFHDVCKYHYLIRNTSASRSFLNINRIYDPIRVKKLILEMNIKGMRESTQKAYMSTCVNVYNTLMLDISNSFHEDEIKVYYMIKENKTWISFLSKKQQLLAQLILRFTKGYKYIYRIYAKYLLKSKYE